MNMVKWIQEWYKTNCDGDWEHSFGIKIGTLDNPGWRIEIDLENTELEFKYFEKIKIDNSSDDWIFCWVENNKFNCASDPNKLEKILEIFREWVESS